MSTKLSPPPVRDPRPVTEEPALTGKRLVVAMEEDGFVQYVHDYRAASECFTEGGRTFVRIVAEADWYAWVNDTSPTKTPSCPRALAVLAGAVWVE